MSVSGLQKSVNRHLKDSVNSITPLDELPSVKLEEEESDDGLVILEESSVSVFADETKEINIFLLTKEDEAHAPPDKKATITKATSFKNLLMTQLPKAIVWYFLHQYLPDDLRMFTLANIGYFEIVFKMNEYETQLQRFITELNEQATTNPLYQNFQDLILQSRKISTKKITTLKPIVVGSQLAAERAGIIDLYLTDTGSLQDTSRKDKRRKLVEPKPSSAHVAHEDHSVLAIKEELPEELPSVTLTYPETTPSVSTLETHLPTPAPDASSSHQFILVKPTQTDEMVDIINSVIVPVLVDKPKLLDQPKVLIFQPNDPLAPPQALIDRPKVLLTITPHKAKRDRDTIPPQRCLSSLCGPGSCVLTKANFQERLCSFRTETHCSMDVGVVIIKGNMRRRVREVKLTEVTLRWLENCFNTGTEIILTKKSLNKNILEQFNNPEKVTTKRSVVSCLDTLRGVALHLIDLELQKEGGDRKKANNKFSHYQRQSRSAGDRLTKEYAEKFGIDAQNYNCSDIEEKMDASLMIFNKGGYLIYCSVVLKKTNCIFYYDGESMFLVKERFVRAFGSRYNFNSKGKGQKSDLDAQQMGPKAASDAQQLEQMPE